ncbi:SIS domain-containing protein [Microbacterium sp. 4R-513]|uniref:D-sedoheptulose-7-phosphate isomerase n=1 Tax=Microbacterium sp. 4R-513 TaxID=2567934 RepID=UPI0013E1DF8D|nr:SIS domain-containing protein [Microbacterium sp. 4R-513]QIG40043.1 SIS domain-containing protein [Microbacterium sp. 4R-513]
MSDLLDAQLAAHIRTAQDAQRLLPDVRAAGEMLIAALEAGGTVYTLGNGGSAADAQHFTGELIGHYRRDRRPLRAVTLTTDATVSTCIANDYSFDDVFSRQVEALARPGDVVAAFTTSGRSPNVVKALEAARANEATTLLFAGGDGGPALALADHAFLAPSTETPRIQELHTFLLHALSEMLDAWAAGERLA